MKDKLIKVIREVPIADKTYPEYVEAVADKLTDTIANIFYEIEEGICAAVSALQFANPIHRNVKHETYSGLMHFIKTIEKKYTEGQDNDQRKAD